jgi:hypothetical protein
MYHHIDREVGVKKLSLETHLIIAILGSFLHLEITILLQLRSMEVIIVQVECQLEAEDPREYQDLLEQDLATINHLKIV